MTTQNVSNTSTRPIIVKFLARGMSLKIGYERWLRQLPGSGSRLGNCQFVFDIKAKEYDWLVVYHDLPRERRSLFVEQLPCSNEKTILVTTEPSTITVYGSGYLRQFGLVLTSQEPWAIPHPNAIFTQPGLIWFYGVPHEDGKAFSHKGRKMLTYDEIKAIPPPSKKKTISTCCSSRKGKFTLHFKRYGFTEQLQSAIPDLVIYGHGVNPVSDKSEALDPYQYHVIIENHVYRHHMTEKLPDAFLGYTLPFYHGCPNAADYFPPESFIPIDIGDPERAIEIIQGTIANNEYEDRLPYIIEARRRVLDEHNIFAVLERVIGEYNYKIPDSGPGGVIMDRHTLRIKKPLVGLQREFEKIITKARHLNWWRNHKHSLI